MWCLINCISRVKDVIALGEKIWILFQKGCVGRGIISRRSLSCCSFKASVWILLGRDLRGGSLFCHSFKALKLSESIYMVTFPLDELLHRVPKKWPFILKNPRFSPNHVELKSRAMLGHLSWRWCCQGAAQGQWTAALGRSLVAGDKQGAPVVIWQRQ